MKLIKQSKEDITLEAGSVDASKGRPRVVFGKGDEGFRVLTNILLLKLRDHHTGAGVYKIHQSIYLCFIPFSMYIVLYNFFLNVSIKQLPKRM